MPSIDAHFDGLFGNETSIDAKHKKRKFNEIYTGAQCSPKSAAEIADLACFAK